MSKPSADPSRRQFLSTGTKATATAAIGSALLSTLTAPHVHAAEDNKIRVGLVGCGGRGTGAALNALSVNNGPIELVALADVFENNLKSTYESLANHREVKQKVNVPEDQRYIGFDGYKKVMDALEPGDVVILATPAAFRWVQYAYAIERGLNVFMEKPVTIDAPTSVRMLEINKAAIQQNLKVAVGLMCRHCVVIFTNFTDQGFGELHIKRGRASQKVEGTCTDLVEYRIPQR